MQTTILTEPAMKMIEKFRLEKEDILAPKYQWKGIFPRCEMFTKEMLEAMLARPGCNYIRIYPALDENNQFRMIAVCAASETSNQLPDTGI